MNIYQLTRLASIRLKLGTQGQKRTVKKSIRNFIIPAMNKLLTDSKCNIEIQSIFFNSDDNRLHLYCKKNDNDIEIIACYDRGLMMLSQGRNKQEIGPAVEYAIKKTLMYSVRQGKTVKRDDKKTIFNTLWLTELQYLLYRN